MPKVEIYKGTPPRTIMDTLDRVGIRLMRECKSGHCRQCVCELVQGEVEYPDCNPMLLSAREVLPCRAILKSHAATIQWG